MDSIFAPFSRNIFTISRYPPEAAANNGVEPLFVEDSREAPFSMRSFTA